MGGSRWVGALAAVGGHPTRSPSIPSHHWGSALRPTCTSMSPTGGWRGWRRACAPSGLSPPGFARSHTGGPPPCPAAPRTSGARPAVVVGRCSTVAWSAGGVENLADRWNPVPTKLLILRLAERTSWLVLKFSPTFRAQMRPRRSTPAKRSSCASRMPCKREVRRGRQAGGGGQQREETSSGRKRARYHARPTAQAQAPC